MKKLFVDLSRPKRRAIARRIGHGKKNSYKKFI